MPKVTIIQRIVPHYRVPFFTALHDRLAADGIDFRLVYGQEQPGTVPATVPLPAPWVNQIVNWYVPTPFGPLVIQPAWGAVAASDLLIVEQASSYLLNYLLISSRPFRKGRLAYWGQGVNVRAKDASRFPERVKAALIRQVDWWFAYTEHTRIIVTRAGYTPERITIVENAVDNEEFRAAIAAITAADVDRIKTELGIGSGPVGLYCGAFIPPKRIDTLIECCKRIKTRLPGFHVIFIGGGPEAEKGIRAAAENTWIHYVGEKFAGERAVYFRAADVLVQPGTVGLVSVDSFVAGLPLFTMDLPDHGPEIAFLRHGENGYIAPVDPEAYAKAVAEYLNSPKQKAALRSGCLESAKKFTMENMVENMRNGILSALAAMSENHQPRSQCRDSFLVPLYRWINAFGINPLGFAKGISGAPAVVSDYFALRAQARASGSVWSIEFTCPCFSEKRSASGTASAHYFHQDLLVARRIFAARPQRHLNVGSRIDGFVAHVATFRKIEVFDIRPQGVSIPNIVFHQGDLMELPEAFVDCCDSLSCLHALGHFGLGRYGDPVDIDGYLKGFSSLERMLKPGGTLYLSVPIGRQRIDFNGHRVFAIETILALASRNFRLERFSYVDDRGTLHEDVALEERSRLDSFGLNYGCGIFEFHRLVAG